MDRRKSAIHETGISAIPGQKHDGERFREKPSSIASPPKPLPTGTGLTFQGQNQQNDERARKSTIGLHCLTDFLPMSRCNHKCPKMLKNSHLFAFANLCFVRIFTYWFG
jgi:hypothetical protein